MANHSQPKVYQYQPRAMLSLILMVLLALQVPLDAASIVGESIMLRGMYTFDADMIDVGLIISLLAVLVQLLLYIPTVVLFCMWAYRANANARALGASDLSVSPGWTVGWFFIPVAHLWKPYQAIAEVDRASGPDDPTDSTSWHRSRTSMVVHLWWAAWVIGSIAVNISSRMIANVPPQNDDIARIGVWMSLAASTIMASAAILAILVVRTINRKQALNWQAQIDALPPVP